MKDQKVITVQVEAGYRETMNELINEACLEYCKEIDDERDDPYYSIKDFADLKVEHICTYVRMSNGQANIRHKFNIGQIE